MYFALDFVFYCALLFLFFLCFSSCIVVTRQKQVKIIEQFGRFVSCKEAGLSLKLPSPIQKVACIVEMDIQLWKEDLSLKTSDNLFINFPMTLKVQVVDPVKAHYELSSPQSTILSQVANTVRSEAGRYDFLTLYEVKNELENKVIAELEETILEYGYKIVGILIDEPIPSPEVRQAYDGVTVSKRNLETARNNAEAEKVKRITEAEAEKQAKELYGQGIAAQRNAIAEGFIESIEKIAESIGTDNKELAASFLLQMTKYDTIRDAAKEGAMIICDGSVTSEFNSTMNLQQLFKEKKAE